MADIGEETKEPNIDVPQIRRQLPKFGNSVARFVKAKTSAAATGTHERGIDRAGKQEVIRFQPCEFVCVADRRFEAIAKK